MNEDMLFNDKVETGKNSTPKSTLRRGNVANWMIGAVSELTNIAATIIHPEKWSNMNEITFAHP